MKTQIKYLMLYVDPNIKDNNGKSKIIMSLCSLDETSKNLIPRMHEIDEISLMISLFDEIKIQAKVDSEDDPLSKNMRDIINSGGCLQLIDTFVLAALRYREDDSVSPIIEIRNDFGREVVYYNLETLAFDLGDEGK